MIPGSLGSIAVNVHSNQQASVLVFEAPCEPGESPMAEAISLALTTKPFGATVLYSTVEAYRTWFVDAV